MASEIAPDTLAKERQLMKIISSYGSLALAYSGGVDSTYLADVAHEVLGQNAHMVINDTQSLPRNELAEALSLARERGWNIAVIATHEFSEESFLRNDGSRCYVCKSFLFKQLWEYARKHGCATVAHGENADDLADQTRVGRRAAAEQEVVAPLKEAGLGKNEIRELSRRRGLPTSEKAAFACLSSRFPVGTRIRTQDMERVEAAEEALRTAGFRQYRARHHGEICRIEVDPAEFDLMLEPHTRERVVAAVLAAGYRFATLDLRGYRMGGTAGIQPENTGD